MIINTMNEDVDIHLQGHTQYTCLMFVNMMTMNMMIGKFMFINMRMMMVIWWISMWIFTSRVITHAAIIRNPGYRKSLLILFTYFVVSFSFHTKWYSCISDAILIAWIRLYWLSSLGLVQLLQCFAQNGFRKQSL